ncbi:hypothetical protein BDFB_000453, partial [Asbolus verrucosus]
MMVTAFIINSMLANLFSIAIIAMIRNGNHSNPETSFDWNESQKQNILGVYFWGYASSKIPSGRFSEMVGPKLVIGCSAVLAAVLTILTPSIAFLNYYSGGWYNVRNIISFTITINRKVDSSYSSVKIFVLYGRYSFRFSIHVFIKYLSYFCIWME